jgi:hypothetical protein
MRGMVFRTWENYWMKDRSDSPERYCTAWRLAVNWWHNSPQEVRDPSSKFMSHDQVVPVKATGK